MNSNIRKVKAIEAQNKKKILSVNPTVNDNSGIYFITRKDEDGIKYAYVGQAKHLLTRLAQHLSGYQHIDLSLKKHGFFSDSNPYGYEINIINYPESDLDEKEKHYINLYAVHGYQLRNKTAGGQGEGKKQIDEYRPAKGYRDGIQQGKINLARELSSIAEKHLKIEIRDDKKNNKVSQKQFEKFKELMNEDSYKTESEVQE